MARTKVLGAKGIIEQMERGATIYRVSGKFGGWGINGTDDDVTVRADSCEKVVSSGLVKATRREFGFVEYGLR